MLALSCTVLSFAPAEVALRPASRAAVARSAPTMGMESELGALGPLGYWDPLGLVRRSPAPRPPLAAGRSHAPRGVPFAPPELSAA